MARDADGLVQQAKLVLDFNWTGEYTRPGPRLYPHQWSWDSALIAIGYASYEPERAMRELRHLLDSQWRNGLLPQIVFNPHYREYFPGVAFWHAHRSPDAPKHRQTSGVVQPPIHATAALHVYRRAGEGAEEVKRFLEYAYPRLAAWHEYLFRERDTAGEGLVYIRHPWESGMDNSPMWDAIMQRLRLREDEIPHYRRADTHIVAAADRPARAEYDRFAYLVQLFAERDYDEDRIRADCPFLVQDVLFNALLCQADKDLAGIAHILGEDPAPYEERSERTARAVNAKLWDDEHETYLDFDLVAGHPIYVYVAPNFVPLYAGIPDEERARTMVGSLKDAGFCLEGARPVPSYDVRGFGFSPVRYWRGPIWVNIDWLLMRGLDAYGYADHAARLRQTIVDLCQEAGFYEYFDPTTGMGLGSDFFSWTAALLLDVLLEER